MNLVGNIIWLIFGGFITGVGHIVGGLGLCLTIVGIPFGIQAIKLGFSMFTPFGKRVVVKPGADDNTLTVIFNVIWIVLFGWEIAIAHLIHAAILAITIVGIPFAQQHMKLLVMSLLPFGRDLR